MRPQPPPSKTGKVLRDFAFLIGELELALLRLALFLMTCYALWKLLSGAL